MKPNNQYFIDAAAEAWALGVAWPIEWFKLPNSSGATFTSQPRFAAGLTAPDGKGVGRDSQ